LDPATVAIVAGKWPGGLRSGDDPNTYRELELCDAGMWWKRGIQRELTEDEKRLADLWNKRGLNSNDFEPGQLVAFLNQIK
jgi:hypothetical protein